MFEQITCPSCGANLTVNADQRSAKCGYCGNVYNDPKPTKPANSNELEQAAKDAISFVNSLNIEVKGQRATITDLWNAYITNSQFTLADVIQFYKKYKPQILFCINAYDKLSDDIKYEIGDFVCSQIESMIRFREENNFVYIDELDTIEAYLKQLQYDLGARGIFDFKGKKVIKEKMKRVTARKTVVLYDYAMKAMNLIVEAYNSKIAPLQDEYNSTARSALARRKELKFQIDSLEIEKKAQIDKLLISQRTKDFNKVVKKYNLKHEDLLIQNRRAFDRSTYVPKTPVEKKPEIDYSAMTTKEVAQGIDISLEKLVKGFTTSEVENCKKLVDELASRGSTMSQEASVYLNAVMMSIQVLFANENPAVMKAMLPNVKMNTKMQLTNLINRLD